MRYLWIIILFIMATMSAAAQTPDAKPILRLDPAFDNIVPRNAKVELVLRDFLQTEGPVWVRKGGYLIFSDIANNLIYKWKPGDAKATVLVEQPDTGFPVRSGSSLGGPNGMTLDRQGRIVYGTRADHSIVRLEKDGRRTTLLSQYEGKNLNGVNDLIYKSNGALYFTDPIFGLAERREKKLPPAAWDLPFMGTYLFKNGKLQLLTKDLKSVNGLAFTPDEKYLYLNDNGAKTILKFEVLPDDTIANGKLFMDMSTVEGDGSADGMKVDRKGNVYCTGPGGIWIISAAGKHLGTIPFPERPANLAFGDPDAKALYVTARKGLYRIRLNVPGILP